MKIKTNIATATPDMASHIASLIMEAMNPQCCQNFAGPQHTLVDFHRMMTRLVEMEDSQYSYRNTLVATNTEGILMGVLVAYDGAQLRTLRERFIQEAIVSFGIDYSGMDSETESGEFYFDSLAVSSNFRGKGVAHELLLAGIERARQLGIPKVGLLCDKSNLNAERLYAQVGFQYVEDTTWGGHAMKRLQINV